MCIERNAAFLFWPEGPQQSLTLAARHIVLQFLPHPHTTRGSGFSPMRHIGHQVCERVAPPLASVTFLLWISTTSIGMRALFSDGWPAAQPMCCLRLV